MTVDLTVCPACRRDFVYPQEFAENGDTHWDILLVCAECDWSRLGTFDQATADRFDRRLDELTDRLVASLHACVRLNMGDEIAGFVEALACDAILPEDF